MTHTAIASRLLFVLTATLCLGTAQAAGAISKATYEGAKADIKAIHSTAHEQCKSKTDNAKDICNVVAKGRERVALAYLENNYDSNDKNRLKLFEAKYEARYDVAKEKCDDLTGDAKNLCQREAKTTMEKSKANMKMDEQITEAMDDAEQARRKADFEQAKERCNAQGGANKDVCEASLKSRYPDL